MIAIDTSALIAIIFREQHADTCEHIVRHESHLLMSAGNAAEAAIVAAGRGITAEMDRLVSGLKIDIVPVTAAVARRVGTIYAQWGRGFHPAALNFGDCFAYELATQRDCPLLFVGEDFTRTDVKRAF